jgi:hypothetical protein
MVILGRKVVGDGLTKHVLVGAGFLFTIYGWTISILYNFFRQGSVLAQMYRFPFQSFYYGYQKISHVYNAHITSLQSQHLV